MSAHHIDGALYDLTSKPLKNNFRDGAMAEVYLRGETTTMRGELITDPATVADLSHRCAQQYGAKKAQRMMGLKFRENRVPTLDEFTEAATRIRMAAIRLTPA